MERYESETLQDDAEFDAYVEILKREKVKSYLEIGSKFGGSLWRAAKGLQPGSTIVCVDMPEGTKAWKESSVSLQKCVDDLSGLGHSTRLIWGDSTNLTVIEQVRQLGPYDAILIDANHTLPFVTKDFANYGPMGRLVAFHDIAWRRAPEWVGVRIDVPQFWNSIKEQYRHEEFKFCHTGKNNGIGVLWRS